uniref:Uncharacterized protein n=1 Tax=Arundo donax TaxID=35708 RepID=A0A0A9DDP1_ARUDO
MLWKLEDINLYLVSQQHFKAWVFRSSKPAFRTRDLHWSLWDR